MDKEIIAGSKQFCITRPTNLYIRAHLAFLLYPYQSHSIKRADIFRLETGPKTENKSCTQKKPKFKSTAALFILDEIQT